jgi:hypothetical protein
MIPRTILNAVGGSYPKIGRSYSSCSSEILLDVADETDLNKQLKEIFYQLKNFDYVLVKWLGVNYLYEKYQQGFLKTPLQYHPLQDKLK